MNKNNEKNNTKSSAQSVAENGRKTSHPTSENRQNKTKQSFGEILSLWERGHNETKAIENKKNAEDKASKEENKLTVNDLKRLKVQNTLDLHNTILSTAQSLTEEFISESFEKGLRKIKIITGKGLHSEGGEAVIRPTVISYLQRNTKIRDINTHPKAAEGGSGAIIVILKEKKPQ